MKEKIEREKVREWEKEEREKIHKKNKIICIDASKIQILHVNQSSFQPGLTMQPISPLDNRQNSKKPFLNLRTECIHHLRVTNAIGNIL